MIQIHNLRKRYSSDFCLEIDELHINDGEKIALVGSNGSGKSTLIKILAGIIEKDEGEIFSSCEKEKTGYLPQSPYIFNTTVYKNIKIGLDKGENKANETKAVNEMLKKVDLLSHSQKKSSTLSGGEQQRMCFARMLVKGYGLLLMDEPLSAVDIQYCDEMEKLLNGYCESNGTTLIVSTHLPLQAVNLSTRMIILNKGKIIEDGKTEEILKNPKTEWGKKFLAQWRL